MLAEWSVECGADDPLLVVPWEDPQGVCRFVDLREDPYALDQIAEAELHPPLMQALRSLNAARSPVFTAKCDAWTMDETELEAAQIDLDMAGMDVPAGFISYIDLIWRTRALFVSLPQQQQRLGRMVRLLGAIDEPYAAVEGVLRPALVDLTGPQEGFAVSLYVKALGTDAAHAYEQWARALEVTVTILRSKDLQ